MMPDITVLCILSIAHFSMYLGGCPTEMPFGPRESLSILKEDFSCANDRLLWFLPIHTYAKTLSDSGSFSPGLCRWHFQLVYVH